MHLIFEALGCFPGCAFTFWPSLFFAGPFDYCHAHFTCLTSLPCLWPFSFFGHAFIFWPCILFLDMPLAVFLFWLLYFFGCAFGCFPFLAIPLFFGHAFIFWLHLYFLAVPLFFGCFIFWLLYFLAMPLLFEHDFGHLPFLAVPFATYLFWLCL